MPVNYYLEKRHNRKNEHPIRISAIVRGVRVLSTTGFSVKEESWDRASMRVRPHQTNSKKQTSACINSYLSRVEGIVLDFENICHSRPSIDRLKCIIRKRQADNAGQPSVIQCFDEFRNEQSVSNQWTAGTLECWTSFRKHLSALAPDKSLDYFDDDGIDAFIRHLRVSAGMEEKSVQKHYRNLRWFLNWAIRKGYASEEDIRKTQPKFKIVEKPVIFLTKEELLKLYRFEIPSNGTRVTLHSNEGDGYEKVIHNASALAKTRDLFCFCAFTSLRYSDMAALKRTDINGDYIYITSRKTNDRLPINLNSFSREILEKYKGTDFPGGAALPVISNQKMNEYLKEVCELCEINQPVTRVCFRAGQREETTRPKYSLVGTHAGRRTFICFALSSGIPPQVVMKWTGHSDYKAMKPYIDIAEKVKSEQMAVFEQGLKR